MRYAETIKQRARAMVERGTSYRETARCLGLGHMTVWEWIHPEAAERSRIRKMRLREANPDHTKAYYKAHRERILMRRKEYREANLDACRASDRRYYAGWDEARREEFRTYMKEWRRRNPEKGRAKLALRRARILTGLQNLSSEEQAAINRIYYMAAKVRTVRCYLCSELIPLGHRHVDHIMPLSKGGMHRPSNLAIACASCNSRKGGKLPAEIGLLV